MITLLPLRGWAGEVMATEMAFSQAAQARIQAELQTQNAIESGAAHTSIHWSKANLDSQKAGFKAQKPLFEAAEAQTTPQTAATHDCDGHAKADKTDQAETTTAEGAACDSCTACQACHTVALSAAAVSFSLAFSPAALPRPAAKQFASAAVALGQKPPIS